jgi:hypothetical protein
MRLKKNTIFAIGKKKKLLLERGSFYRLFQKGNIIIIC